MAVREGYFRPVTTVRPDGVLFCCRVSCANNKEEVDIELKACGVYRDIE